MFTSSVRKLEVKLHAFTVIRLMCEGETGQNSGDDQFCVREKKDYFEQQKLPLGISGSTVSPFAVYF